MSNYFILLKRKKDFLNFKTTKKFDIIYFDAFAPDKQPDMWSEKMLFKIYRCLKKGGFIVTYCAKGVIKRRLKMVGFELETLIGPPGKKEMIRANKK